MMQVKKYYKKRIKRKPPKIIEKEKK